MLPGREYSLLGTGLLLLSREARTDRSKLHNSILPCTPEQPWQPHASGDSVLRPYHAVSPQHTISKVALGVTCRDYEQSRD